MFFIKKEVIFLNLKNCWIKSKTIVTQYIAICSGLLTQYGNDILDAFNSNSSQIESILPKVFTILSVLCAILTIYLRITSKNIIVKKEDNNV